jgi:hypothetical protein
MENIDMKEFVMKKFIMTVLGITLVLGVVAMFPSCLSPIDFVPDNNGNTNITGSIDTNDVTSAILMLVNRSKTVDVTRVRITQPEWMPPDGNANAQPPSISFANQPRRLEKKAQYLTPSDKNYQVVIDYAFDAWNKLPAGTGTRTLSVPLPQARQIVEIFIYRSADGTVVIDDDVKDPDTVDIGNPAEDLLKGEGSSPAVIPPENRNRMATLIVINKSTSQVIDGVNFRMGSADYTMGSIGTKDKQSIALGQGSWATRLTYTRYGVEKTLGPINSVVVPSNDPQSVREHYLYFYLNNRGEYAISPEWPPYPNDAMEEDLLPPDNGYGRGLIKIINNSSSLVGMVTIQNLKEANIFPFTIDYYGFTPPIPIQYSKTGYVDVIGTAEFPIDGHDGYLIQVTLENSEDVGIVERKAYIKDQMVTIVISADDLQFNNTQGAKVTLENRTSDWPVEIINFTIRNRAVEYRSSYFGTSTWEPHGVIGIGKSAVQYVMSTTAMPITPDAQFDALVAIQANGVTMVVTKNLSPAILYSIKPPDQNPRTITITDADVPDSIKKAYRSVIVKLENNTNLWPVDIIGMTVQSKANTAHNTVYDVTTWAPNGSIAKDNYAIQTVMGTIAMPIDPGVKFEAVITLHSSGLTVPITKSFSPAELYSEDPPGRNTRTITITDSDVPQSIKENARGNGATIVIENKVRTDWPIQVTAMELWSKPIKTQTAVYGSSTFEPSGMITNDNEAKQVVISSDNFTMAPNIEYEANIHLYGYNGEVTSVVKPLSPAELYSNEAPDRNVRTITITDTDIPTELQTPTVVPPNPINNGAMVTLENKTSSWPVDIIGMTVKNKVITTESTYYTINGWVPQGTIMKGDSAVQTVLGSTNMPITSGDEFEAQIVIGYNGATARVTKAFIPPVLYSTLPLNQNTRTITISDSDVPDSIKDAYILSRGAKVTLENKVSARWPVQITVMKVQNKTTKESTTYSSTTWDLNNPIDNGKSAIQMVSSTTSMPIKPGVEFEALITLYGNGNTETITKAFSPATLYSELAPEQNTRTITITDSDVPAAVQTPDPPPPSLPDIAGAKDGDTIVIDGIEWIKVRTDPSNKDMVLLMLKGVTGPKVKYNSSGRISEYNTNTTEIKKYVDNWYSDLLAPTLKQIARKANTGASPSASWPLEEKYAETPAYDWYAFLPRLADIDNLIREQKANGYTYWLTNLYPLDTTMGVRFDMMGIVLADGDTKIHTYAYDSFVYVRPCIWVTSKL